MRRNLDLFKLLLKLNHNPKLCKSLRRNKSNNKRSSLISSSKRRSKDKPKLSKPRISSLRLLLPSNKDKRRNYFLNKELLNSPNSKRKKLLRDLKPNVLSKSSLLLKLSKNLRLLLPRKPLLGLMSPD